MLSHGFLFNIINEKDLELVNLKLRKFSDENEKNLTYISEINKIIPCVSKLINLKVLSKVKKLLDDKEPAICNVELHIQHKNSKKIPAHQDNFYHCIKPKEGLKIFIPLQPMDRKTGALTFMDCDVNFPVQTHIPSEVENFSSYIPKNEFNRINLKQKTYNYKLCDASYHFMNSIHFSNGNHSNRDMYFIVFRFQKPNATINKKALAKYEECLSNHKKFIN